MFREQTSLKIALSFLGAIIVLWVLLQNAVLPALTAFADKVLAYLP